MKKLPIEKSKGPIKKGGRGSGRRGGAGNLVKIDEHGRMQRVEGKDRPLKKDMKKISWSEFDQEFEKRRNKW